MEENLELIKMLLGKYNSNEIGAIRYPGGTLIGKKRAQGIISRYKKLIDDKNPNLIKEGSKLLSSIPRISENMATIILKEISLKEIVSAIVKDDDIKKMICTISLIQFSSKRKVGKSVSSNIIKYLTII